MNRHDAEVAKSVKTLEPDASVDRLAHQVIGAAIEVHRQLGPGFLESVYETALAIEFDLQGVPFERQKPIELFYKGHSIGDQRLDFVVDHSLIVELKAIEKFAPIHSAITISYLRATGLQLCLLINFNVPVLKNGIKRVVLTQ